MGRVQQLAREGKKLAPGSAVDEHGRETTDPAKVKALLPFGQHKGYGLSLIDELLAAYTGGSLPTLRSRWSAGDADEKHTPSFYFQCIRPDAVDCGDFAKRRSQRENVKLVIEDILGHGNERAILPGQLEACAAALSDRHGGLLFTRAEIDAFASIAADAGVAFDSAKFKTVEVE
jgi:LDH2 family malate/lactate/ureidoglycolate dehydrogenase